MINREFSASQKFLAICMSSIMLCMALFPSIVSANTCLDGKLMGEEDGQRSSSPAWILAGIGCGCLGVAGAYLITGTAPADNFIGQSPEYIECYTDAFKKGRRSRQATYATIGWGIWMVIYFAAIYPETKDD